MFSTELVRFSPPGENSRSMDFGWENRRIQTLSLTTSLCTTVIGQFLKSFLAFYDESAVGAKHFGQHGISDIFPARLKIAVPWVPLETSNGQHPFIDDLAMSKPYWTMYQKSPNKFLTRRLCRRKILFSTGFVRFAPPR